LITWKLYFRFRLFKSYY